MTSIRSAIKAMKPAQPAGIERCPLCGGNAGRFIPEGGHELCKALAARGLPTPSLGEKCQACGGSGNQRRDMPRGVLLPMMPSGREIRLWFPACETCKGTGAVQGGAE